MDNAEAYLTAHSIDIVVFDLELPDAQALWGRFGTFIL
jgi:hypothetical protein